MTETDDFKRVLYDNRNENIAKESCVEKTMKTERGSSVCAAVLYKKDALADFKRQMAMSSSHEVSVSSQNAPERTRYPVSTMHGHETQRKLRDSLMASKSNDQRRNSETCQLPRPVAGLIKIYSDRTGTSLKLSSLPAYLARTPWLSFTNIN